VAAAAAAFSMLMVEPLPSCSDDELLVAVALPPVEDEPLGSFGLKNPNDDMEVNGSK